MQYPRLPAGLIYTTVVLALVLAAVGRRQQAGAPAAPPPRGSGPQQRAAQQVLEAANVTPAPELVDEYDNIITEVPKVSSISTLWGDCESAHTYNCLY